MQLRRVERRVRQRVRQQEGARNSRIGAEFPLSTNPCFSDWKPNFKAMTALQDYAPAPAAEAAAAIPFDNSYARLPGAFYERVTPTKVAAPELIRLNDALAGRLGIDPAYLRSKEGVAVLSGNAIAAGSEPIAQAYAGHQFGNFVPQLGDGRAVLLGEVLGTDGRCYDIQLKGSGPTQFSRRGDGRAALGPVIREYFVSEAMAALRIPTTRSLAAIWTGETVRRESMLPGGVLTRVASSHIRVGTFQYFAARRDFAGVRTLADYAIARHYPDIKDAPDRYLAFFDAVSGRLADLTARWMCVGFIHGVLNTDNTSIAGETIDYGPCAFMDAYHPAKVFSSIDQFGRYAFANQPSICRAICGDAAPAYCRWRRPGRRSGECFARSVRSAFSGCVSCWPSAQAWPLAASGRRR
jgi:uncharacterized protein YdiU (UPF0061 family)